MKKNYTIFIFVTALILFMQFKTVYAANNLQPLVVVDSPVNNAQIVSSVNIQGWAINGSGINYVNIYLDGSWKGTAKIGLSRTDVAKVYPGYIGASTSGFSYLLDINTVTAGAHAIKVRAVGNDGSVQEATVNVNIGKVVLPSIVKLESPVQSQNITKSFNVSGYALNGSGTNYVNIYLDGSWKGTAKIGISRTDVANLYPKYSGAATSGFSYLLDVNTIAAGAHAIKVRAVGNDGSVKEGTINVNVSKLPPIINVDSPVQNRILTKSFNVSGWALNASGIKYINMYLDGSWKGTANIGISRTDVANLYPGYGNAATSGFSYLMDINTVTAGAHVIKIRAVGNDGSVKEGTVNVNVSKLAPIVNVDSPVQNQNISTSNTINGWALNASGVNYVNIYLDGSWKGTAKIGLSRTDVANAYPSYIGAATSGFSYNLAVDRNRISGGNHKLEVRAVGNDGSIVSNYITLFNTNTFISTSYPTTLADFVNKEMLNSPALQLYNSTTGRWEWRYAEIVSGQKGYSLDSGTFVSSTDVYNQIQQSVSDNMDPSKIANDPVKIYEFLKLNYSDCVTAGGLNAIFNDNGVLAGKGQVFIDAAKMYNVNPIYLAAHSILETGNGTSLLAKGVVVNGVTAYNLFGIQAFDSDPVVCGSTYAYSQGWTTIDSAIYGGAAWIADGYIGKSQDTLYKMRWNFSNTPHQYATDVKWAANQVQNIKNCFDLIKDPKLTFEIPAYN
jgi:beta-N-acetylglucosaminidase